MNAGWTLDAVAAPGNPGWEDLHAWIKHHVMLAPDSAIYLSVHGHSWSHDREVAAATFDLLHGANWQRGARRGSPRPKPFPRPEALRKAAATTENTGQAEAPLEDVMRMLRERNGR